MKILLFAATLLYGLALPAAEAKVALVIGNDAYRSNTFGSLDKAVSDAHTLSEKLKSLDFKVIEKSDVTAEQMRQAVVEFSDELKRNNDVGVFYFAGHGLQIDGNNYLIPIAANISREFEARTEAINADLILDAMFDAKARISIVILDACRDNQFSNRGGKRGLANIARENTFIAFATQPDKTAEDGTFMRYFSQRITEPLPIDQMFKRVINDVRDATRQDQVPSYHYGLIDDFYFNYQSGIPSSPSPSQATVTMPMTAPKVDPPPLSFEPEMVLISAQGRSFQMGSPDSEQERDSDEGRHRVSFDKDYHIGKTEVTQAQWRAVMGSDPPELYHKNCDDCPVERVSWDDVQTFIAKLNKMTGKDYRLPTEAEWEYACQGGADHHTYCGGEEEDRLAWYVGNSGRETHPVKQKAPNGWDLYDMSGNVWEWTCSGYDKDYQGGEKQCTSNNDANTVRVVRGGSWGLYPSWLRSAYRLRTTPAYRGLNVGFRLARM